MQTTYDTTYKCKALVVEALPRLLHVKPPQLAVRGLIPVAAASWAFSQQLCARQRLRQEIRVCFPLQYAYIIQTTWSKTSRPCPPVVAVLVLVPAASAVPLLQVRWRAWLRLPGAAGVVGPDSAGFTMLGARRIADALVAVTRQKAGRLGGVWLVRR